MGIRAQGLTREALVSEIGKLVRRGERVVVANHNLNSINLYHRDARFRRLVDSAALIHIDGMPIIWLARLLGHRLRPDHRVTYVDLIQPLLREAARQKWRVFFLGGRPGVGELALSRIQDDYPDLALATAHGFFDTQRQSETNRTRLAMIADFSPDILLVGMGMPRQEHWILDYFERINATVILPCGACMDYLAEVVTTPPRWAGHVGIEWAFRLAAEPRRLYRRYLIDPWALAPLVIREFAAIDSRSTRSKSKAHDA